MGAQDPPASGPARPGQRRVSHYELLEILGQGGMGTVYRARDLSLPREVALKRPRVDGGSDPDLHRRFLREGKAASALSHPNIVRVFEVFEAEGVPWIAMEYVPGTSLREELRARGAMGWERIVHAAEELAGALGEAHRGRVLHRDIKPGNVLLGRDGRARLVDFGLARKFVHAEEASSASTQSSDITRSGGVAGTLAYMSPEQVLGHELDERSDIFSLGAVLYEMCTGRQAFTGSERGQLLDAILNHEPVAIGRLNYEVPGEFERIVRKCLSKNREDRYPDAADLLVDVRRLRKETDSAGYVSGERDAHRPPPRRRPTPALLTVLILAAALGATAVVSRWLPPEGGSPRNDPRAWFDRGVHYMEEQETEKGLNEAIRLFTRAVEGEPEFAAAHAALGNAWWERYRLSGDEVHQEEARAAVSRALELDPDSAWGHNARGYGFLVTGSLEGARREFLLALEADPSMARTWSNLGQACAELGRYEEGLDALKHAIRLRPDHFRYRLRMGVFLDRFSEHQAARKAYLKAIDLKPDSWIAWGNLGASQLRSGDFEAAVPSLLRAAQIEDTADIRSNLGTAYYYLGRMDEALASYRRAVELEPGRAVLRANLGDALRELGREDEAREAYLSAIPMARKAAEREPGRARAHARLGMYCARAGEMECALTEADHLAGLATPEADTSMSAAVIYCLAGRVKEALDSLERAVRLGISRARIEADPDLSRLSGEPRYRRILQLAG